MRIHTQSRYTYECKHTRGAVMGLCLMFSLSNTKKQCVTFHPFLPGDQSKTLGSWIGQRTKVEHADRCDTSSSKFTPVSNGNVGIIVCVCVFVCMCVIFVYRLGNMRGSETLTHSFNNNLSRICEPNWPIGCSSVLHSDIRFNLYCSLAMYQYTQYN